MCSYLGLSKSLIRDKKTKTTLESIQRDLFVIGAEIATRPNFLPMLKRRLDKTHLNKLEKAIQNLEDKRKFEGCCFYLPGGNIVSSSLDISRTVTRRVERKAVTLKRKKALKNPYILVYLNRLSDLLYLMARSHDRAPVKL